MSIAAIPSQQSIDQICVNTIRTLSIDGGSRPNLSTRRRWAWRQWSMSFAEVFAYDPVNPISPNRDRFVLPRATRRC